MRNLSESLLKMIRAGGISWDCSTLIYQSVLFIISSEVQFQNSHKEYGLSGGGGHWAKKPTPNSERVRLDETPFFTDSCRFVCCRRGKGGRLFFKYPNAVDYYYYDSFVCLLSGFCFLFSLFFLLPGGPMCKYLERNAERLLWEITCRRCPND